MLIFPFCMSDIESEKRMGAACRESFDSMNTKLLSPRKKVLILGRDQSDLRLFNELFPDNVLSEVCIFSGSPGDLGSDSSIFTGPLKSCFIVVEARVLKDEFQSKLQTKSYECMLELAKRNVGKNIFLKYAYVSTSIERSSWCCGLAFLLFIQAPFQPALSFFRPACLNIANTFIHNIVISFSLVQLNPRFAGTLCTMEEEVVHTV